MKRKKLSLFAVAVVLAAVATLPAAAQLRGSYAATGSTSCLASPSGFTDLVPNTAATAYAESFTERGTYKFKADGTGTYTGSASVFDYLPAPYVAASGVTVSVPFTYTVAKHGRLTLVFGTVTGSFVAGEFVGLTFAGTILANSTGRIGQNGTGVLTTATPTVDTLTLYYEGIEVALVTRICTRTHVLVPE